MAAERSAACHCCGQGGGPRRQTPGPKTFISRRLQNLRTHLAGAEPNLDRPPPNCMCDASFTVYSVGEKGTSETTRSPRMLTSLWSLVGSVSSLGFRLRDDAELDQHRSGCCLQVNTLRPPATRLPGTALFRAQAADPAGPEPRGTILFLWLRRATSGHRRRPQ